MPNLSVNLSQTDITITGTVTAAALSLSGNASAARFLAANDSVGAPGHSYTSDPNTGLYRGGADVIALSAGGVLVVTGQAGIAQVNGAAFASTLLFSNQLRQPPTALQTLTAVGNTITFDGTNKRTSASGALVMTSTPTIALGNDGDLLLIVHESANGVTLTDEGGLAGSGLRLGAATRVLALRTSLLLIMRGGVWVELAFKA